MTPSTVPNFPPTTDVYGVDFETSYTTGRDIKSLGVWPYLRHPDTQIYLVSIHGPGVSYCGPLETAPWPQISGKHWVSHNAGFDYAVYVVAGERGQIPDNVYPIEWDCTANLAAFCGANRSLAGAVAAIFDVKLSKVTRDEMKGQRWETMTPEFQAECIRYALDDAKWCWEIWDSCHHNWPAQEVAASRHTLLVCSRGVAIDLAYVADAEAKLKHALWETEGKIPWAGSLDLKGKEIKITSTKALKDECAKIGIPAPLSTADKNEIFDKWLSEYEGKAPFVAAVKAHRSLNRTLDIVGKFRDRTQADGRMQYELKYFGAHCFTGDHEVLTPEGWVELRHWAGGAIVQMLDGRATYSEARPNVFHDVEEKLVTAKTGQVNFTVTQGHWMAVLDKGGRLVKRQAGDVFGKAASIPLSAAKREGVKGDPIRLRLRVATQADGHYMSDCRTIRFRFKRLRKIERMRELLDGSELDWKEVYYPSEPEVAVFLIRQYPAWLEGAKDFQFSLAELDQESLDVFFDELPLWDGTGSGPNSFTYVTTSKNNAEVVQTLAHLSGRAALISCKPHVNRPNWSPSYHVSIRKSSNTRVKKGDWSISDVGAGTVYCPTSMHGVILIRHKGTVFFSGNTGRWSGGGGINCQNLTKKPVAGVDLRGCIYPTPGKKFIVADLSQIEARVALWYAEDGAQLELLKNGMDVYEAHARATMGYNQPGSLKEYCAELPLDHKDKKMRDIAKARVLGLGFGMGHVRLIDFAKTLIGIDLSVAEAKQIVNGFRHANKGIVRMWDSLHSAMENHAMKHRPKAVANFTGAAAPVLEPTPAFSIELPSWRSLEYYDVSMADGLKAKDERGGLATHWFGGKLYENLVQSTARDILVEAILRIEEAGYPVVLHVHDEVICEVPLDTDPEVIRAMMTITPEWAPGLPIDSSSESAERYFK